MYELGLYEVGLVKHNKGGLTQGHSRWTSLLISDARRGRRSIIESH